MKLVSSFSLDLENDSEFYYNLLKEEDFDFKTKNIIVDSNLIDKKLKVDVRANSILDLKIGVSAVIKSLEVINKTLRV